MCKWSRSRWVCKPSCPRGFSRSATGTDKLYYQVAVACDPCERARQEAFEKKGLVLAKSPQAYTPIDPEFYHLCLKGHEGWVEDIRGTNNELKYTTLHGRCPGCLAEEEQKAEEKRQRADEKRAKAKAKEKEEKKKLNEDEDEDEDEDEVEEDERLKNMSERERRSEKRERKARERERPVEEETQDREQPVEEKTQETEQKLRRSARNKN